MSGKSGKKTLIRIFCIMLVVTIFCFIVCGIYAIYITENEMIYCNAAALDIYLTKLSDIMESLEQFNDDLVTNDSSFNLLTLKTLPTKSTDSVLAQRNIARLIENRVESMTAIMLYNETGTIMYYCIGSGFLNNAVSYTPHHIEAMYKLKDYLLEEHPMERTWNVYTEEEDKLLINTFSNKGLHIVSMIDICAYALMDEGENQQIEYSFLTESQILTNEEKARERGFTLEDMIGATDLTVRKNYFHDILQTKFSENSSIGLCGMISLSGVWAYIRIYTMILLVSLGIVVTLFAVIYKLLDRMLIYPLNQITFATKQLSEGSLDFEQADEKILEFSEIQSAIHNLVQEKVNLQQEIEDESAQKEHALLQYYQLQTRSHFFLNCLKSIYNLSAKGEKERTMRTISLFSNHLRYIYHDSLKFVTIRQELDEVRDYFSIIELERSDHILLDEKVDEELLDFQVPPLIIQTFVENFNKHNAESDHVLRFAIRIDKVELDEQEYVRIRMMDNGVGYSEETIQMLQTRDIQFGQYHVGVQNLCRRMDILYNKKYQMMFSNNRNGGALTVFYLPVKAEA